MAKNKQQGAGRPGVVKKSTALLLALVAFAAGLYGGTLIAGARYEQTPAAQSGKVSIREGIGQAQGGVGQGGSGQNGLGQSTLGVAGQNAPGQGAQSGISQQHASELEKLRRATLDDPRNVGAWNKLGHWYFDHSMPKEAVAAYEKSLAIKPDDPDIVTDKGVMHRAMHEHEKALEHFQRANGIAPGHQASLFNIGVALLDLERRQEALEAWKRLQAMNPNFKTPRGITITETIRLMSQ